MIEIKVTGNTMEEIKEQMGGILDEKTKPANVEKVETKKKPKKAAKKDDKKEPAIEEEVAAEAVESVSNDDSVATVTKEEVQKALQEVNKTKGLTKAREILALFNVGRISELNEGQYAEFILECEK